MSVSPNPLLEPTFPFPYDRVLGEHVAPSVEPALAWAEVQIAEMSDPGVEPTYASTLLALDEMAEGVGRRIGPVTHLLGVAETPELREAYNQVLPQISAFWTRLFLNEELWAAIKRFAESDEARGLEGIHARNLERTLMEFRRAGADLPPEDKARLEALQVELAQKEQKFSENVLDATNAYQLHIADEARLEGIPEAPLRRFAARAADEDLEGWVLTLDFPSFEAVMKHGRDRALREEIHAAFTGRCRDGELDNTGLIVEILRIRRDIARLLGHADFPDYRTEDLMSKTGQRAREFEADLEARTRPYWERDLAELQAHAADLGISEMEPWDVSFVTEDLRKTRFAIDDEVLRPYFPLDRVEAGLFELAELVFGLTVRSREPEGLWNADVKMWDLIDSDGTHLATWYSDWFPRADKRQGAWMNNLSTGGPGADGSFEPHTGFIGGNFTPPDGDRPALLTHREVETLFHEFGHLLHHTTSRIPVRGRAGLNVPWDFVEVPSQIMENWCWEKEALNLFARHHETGEPLPDELFERMRRAQQFQGGWFQMRQISFGTLDLALHTEYDPDSGADVLEFVETTLARFGPTPNYSRRNIAAVFTHLFSGGYASAYYSYLWSEVLEADAFSRFREEGIFNLETGRAFMDCILTRGDSADPDELFREFMGRDPDPEALLERNLGALEAEAV
jgi:oligopeptidase A